LRTNPLRSQAPDEIVEVPYTTNPLRSQTSDNVIYDTISLRKDPLHTNPLRTNPLRTNPLQTNPLRTNPLRTNPLRSEAPNDIGDVPYADVSNLV
jgi:hypothetical protein